MKILNRLLFIFFIIYPDIASGSMVLPSLDDLRIPTRKAFDSNSEFIKPFKLKKITIAEYLTDPLILYASLWGCFFITMPIWEKDKDRGLDKIYDNPYFHITNGNTGSGYAGDDTFIDRLKMEPFAYGRNDPITKEWQYNGQTYSVFRNDIYVKNIIEPVYFTYLVLYMRAKNYHPAIVITEIILLSLIYELTIRPFYMNSSFEQFLKNPGIAIVVGILLDEISSFLLTTPYVGLHVLAYILNPFNSLPNARIKPMLFFDPYRKQVSIEAIVRF